MCNYKCCRKPLSGTAAIHAMICAREELKRKGVIIPKPPKARIVRNGFTIPHVPKEDRSNFDRPIPPKSQVIREGIDPKKVIITKPRFPEDRPSFEPEFIMENEEYETPIKKYSFLQLFGGYFLGFLIIIFVLWLIF